MSTLTHIHQCPPPPLSFSLCLGHKQIPKYTEHIKYAFVFLIATLHPNFRCSLAALFTLSFTQWLTQPNTYFPQLLRSFPANYDGPEMTGSQSYVFTPSYLILDLSNLDTLEAIVRQMCCPSFGCVSTVCVSLHVYIYTRCTEQYMHWNAHVLQTPMIQANLLRQLDTAQDHHGQKPYMLHNPPQNSGRLWPRCLSSGLRITLARVVTHGRLGNNLD